MTVSTKQLTSNKENASLTDKIRHPKKRAFLSAYAHCGNISQAAEMSGVGRASHYEWLKKDDNYAKAFEDALEQFVDILEAEADRRAILGVDEPVFQGGQQVGVRRKYSDTLLMFRLNGLAPEKYKYRSHVKQETTVTTTATVGIQDLSHQQQYELLTDMAARLRELGALED